MKTTARIPERYIVVKGAGQSDFGPGLNPWETASFDLALLDAGIANFNIMKYSSVLPRIAKQIQYGEAVSLGLLKHGMVLESIMAQVNGRKGEFLCAGVGTAKVFDGDVEIGGFAAEYEGHDTEIETSNKLMEALHGIFDRRYSGNRNYKMGDLSICTESLQVEKKFGTVLVALGFVSFAVEVLENF